MYSLVLLFDHLMGKDAAEALEFGRGQSQSQLLTKVQNAKLHSMYLPSKSSGRAPEPALGVVATAPSPPSTEPSTGPSTVPSSSSTPPTAPSSRSNGASARSSRRRLGGILDQAGFAPIVNDSVFADESRTAPARSSCDDLDCSHGFGEGAVSHCNHSSGCGLSDQSDARASRDLRVTAGSGHCGPAKAARRRPIASARGVSGHARRHRRAHHRVR